MESAEMASRMVVAAANSAASKVVTRLQQQAKDQSEDFRRNYGDAIQEAVEGLVPLLKRLLYAMVVGIVLLLTSMSVYGLFYIIVIPRPHASKHLHFDYSCVPNMPAYLNECSEDSMICPNFRLLQEELDRDSKSKCSPSATVDLFAKQSSWEYFHDDVIPKPLTTDRILRAHKPYFFEITLELPESSLNRRDVGMFAVSVELTSSNNTKLARSTRSSRLPHESDWIGVIRKSITIIPLLLGALTESRTVYVPSFRHFVESASEPLQFVRITLMPSGKWSSPVEIVSGELRIGKELTSFQWLLKEWFFSCAFVGVSFIFAFQLAAYLVLVNLIAKKRQRMTVQPEDEIEPTASENLGEIEYLEEEGDVWEPMGTEVEGDAGGAGGAAEGSVEPSFAEESGGSSSAVDPSLVVEQTDENTEEDSLRVASDEGDNRHVESES